MPANDFTKMRSDYPDMIVELVKFFDMANTKESTGELKPRSVGQFFDYYTNLISREGPQPYLIVRACQRLAQRGSLTEMSTGGFQGIDNRYACAVQDMALFSNVSFSYMLDCVVYGLQAVYDIYGKSVLAIVNEDTSGNLQIGSSFVAQNQLLFTAAHCIFPATSLSLQGVSGNSLSTAKYYIHPNEALDISAIFFDEPVFSDLPKFPLAEAPPLILDEVMALGYPNVPGYHPTLSAEAASISGRFTATRGRIASSPTEIFSNCELFLITARVRGGFSGGPIVDNFGQVVGVISREPGSQDETGAGHQYDNLGYGTAIPSERVRELYGMVVRQEIEPIDMSRLTFSDFI